MLSANRYVSLLCVVFWVFWRRVEQARWKRGQCSDVVEEEVLIGAGQRQSQGADPVIAEQATPRSALSHLNWQTIGQL